jgi:hypothetical protein
MQVLHSIAEWRCGDPGFYRVVFLQTLRPLSAMWARVGFCGWLDGGSVSLCLADAAFSEEIAAIVEAVGLKKRWLIKVIL